MVWHSTGFMFSPNFEKHSGIMPTLSHASCISFLLDRSRCPSNARLHTSIKLVSLFTLLLLLGSDLDVLAISDNNVDLLVTALAVLISNSILLVITVAEVAADEMSRSVV